MNYALEVREKSEDTAHAPATRDPPGQPGAGPAALPPTYTIPTLERTSTRHFSSTSLACVAPPALQVLLPWLSPVLSPWLYREGDNQGRIQVLTQVAYARHPRQLGKRSTRCGREALHTRCAGAKRSTRCGRELIYKLQRAVSTLSVSLVTRAPRGTGRE